MLGIGSAAAIPDYQKLVARAQRRDDDSRDFPRGAEQRCILRRLLERGQRLLQMDFDRIF
jgi:hypothetical protein